MKLNDYLAEKYPPKPTVTEDIQKALLSQARPSTVTELAETINKSVPYVHAVLSKNPALYSQLTDNYKLNKQIKLHQLYVICLSRPHNVKLSTWARKNGTNAAALAKAKHEMEELIK